MNKFLGFFSVAQPDKMKYISKNTKALTHEQIEKTLCIIFYGEVREHIREQMTGITEE